MFDCTRSGALYVLAVFALVPALESAAWAESVRTVMVGAASTAGDSGRIAPSASASFDVHTGGSSDAAQLDDLPYVPGRLIVKLDEVLGRSARSSVSAGRATFGIAALDRLNRRYGARSLDRPFDGRAARLAARGGMNDRRTARSPSGSSAASFDNVYIIEISRHLDMEAVAREYQRIPGVVYAEPDREVALSLVTNDPYLSSSGAWGQAYGDLWGLDKIDAPAAWDVTSGGGVVVAVIDTGIDAAHPDIAPRMWVNPGEIAGNGVDDESNGYVDDVGGWDFSNDDSDPFDDHGHGTHVAGTVAAVGNNGIGVVGVAWEASVMAVKGIFGGGGGAVSDLAEAILYAADNGADVINASWGGFGESELISDAVVTAYAAGVVFVAAAGNSAADAREYFPAGNPEAITVSAFDSTDTVAFFSNFGPAIDVAAPGGGDAEPSSKFDPHRSVLSLRSSGAGPDMTGGGKLVIDGDYLRQAGTSMAAPHVAGAAALILAAHPLFSIEKVRQVLRASADDVDLPDVDANSGYGRLDAGAALAIDSALDVVIASPAYDDIVSVNSADIVGTASGDDFQSYAVEYGVGEYPSTWSPVLAAGLSPVDGGVLATWDVSGVPDGLYTIRIRAATILGDTFEDRATVTLDRLIIDSPASYSIHGGGGSLEIHGTAYTSEFGSYSVEYRAIDPDLSEGPWLATGITLAAGGSLPVLYGVLATLDTSVFATGRELDLRLSVAGAAGVVSEIFYHVVIDPDLRAGWPVTIPGLPNRYERMQGHVTLADIDADGTKEILAAYGDLVFVFSADGTDFPGWPQSVAEEDPEFYIIADSAPAAADLDNDGDLELVAGNGKTMYIWHHDGTPFAGWPKVVTFGEEPYVWGAPRDYTIADIDGDGLRDIVMTRGPSVAAMRSDGTFLPGWPVTIFSLYLSPPPFERSVAVGDVTGDGRPEIVVVESRGNHGGQDIHVYDATGNEIPGFPQRAAKKYRVDDNSAVLADLNGDGVLDIATNSDKVTRLSTYDGFGNRVRMRSRIPNFRFKVYGAGTFHSQQELLSAGDINGDGNPELLVSTEVPYTKLRCGGGNCSWWFLGGTISGTSFIQVVDEEESQVPGWPVALDFQRGDNAHGPGSVAVGDIDGDGAQDLVVGTGMCWAAQEYAYHRCFSVDAFHADGSRLSGFPKPIPLPGATKSVMPAIGDIDGDGLKEIAFIDFNGNVMVWTVPGTPGPENLQWPMFRHDPAHTGALQ